MNILKLVLLTALALTLSACFPSNQTGKKELLLQGHTMGTTYSIKVVATVEQVEQLGLQNQIDDLLKKVNQQMSTYIADSELSVFNQSMSLAPVTVSAGLARVMQESLRLGNLTKGKLDVTVGPLVNLWGFGPEKRPEKVPSDSLLAETKARVGLQHLTLSNNTLSKAIPNLYVDLSTIAKGYGVDLVAELIEENGIHNYLVEIGGELRVNGFKHTGELWVVGVKKPLTTEHSVQQLIVPKNNAMATSGDYYNYFESNGVRFSHIIDPDTGKPINHKLVSVTVIHPSSMTADGLSTALMVMGMEKGMVFAEENDIAAFFIAKTENGFEEQFTVKFHPYLK